MSKVIGPGGCASWGKGAHIQAQQLEDVFGDEAVALTLAFKKASMSSSPDSPAAFSFSRSSRRYSARTPALVSLWQSLYIDPLWPALSLSRTLWRTWALQWHCRSCGSAKTRYTAHVGI